ncbi:protein of unknown function DUF1312 [Gottschalkia purinilytica]|uniref:Uncharacterized protein n=1 Tax=Gottschalkia purinilytica TaxID=1503 RepID=A0A0L0WDG6_GOTPU|nr:NusG domain II-containing protein [Gottschalkia purinilytica]KNF09465.1 protein of unknown function DUF1312 [Gottschalkia purinilytica]
MTKYDKYLIFIILISSFIGIYYVNKIATNSSNKYVNIELDGKKYKKITLDNKEMRTLEIKTKFGYNKLEINKGKVRVVEANCPDQLDVKQGYITRPGEMIVCLPNRLVIEIKTESKTNKEIDYISY